MPFSVIRAIKFGREPVDKKFFGFGCLVVPGFGPAPRALVACRGPSLVADALVRAGDIGKYR
jgi:hypothetical protein